MVKLGQVCTSVSARDCRELAKKSELAFSLGSDLIELRLDHLLKPSAAEILDRLSGFFPRAVVAVRNHSEGGAYSGSETSRIGLLRALAAAAPAFVDVELETAKLHTGLVASLGGPTAIVSWHDLRGTPPRSELVRKEESAAGFPGLVKIVTMAKTPEDPPRVLSLYQWREPQRLIAFCMGDLGVPSRVTAMKLGSPLMYCSLPGEPLAPGQVTVTEMISMVESARR